MRQLGALRVFRSPYQAGRWAPGSVIAIGKFDGVHLGHQKLLRSAVRRAKALATRCLVLTFDPPPQEYFTPDQYRPLVPLARKLERLGHMGVDATVLLPFNHRLACQAPEAFVRDVLARALKAMDVYVGTDFCFGKDRAGRVPTLKDLGQKLGFLVHPVPLLRKDGAAVSASLIRKLLDEGQPERAKDLLGELP